MSSCETKVSLTACPCVSAVCSALFVSPCTSSEAQPGGHDIPLPQRPTCPLTFCSTAAQTHAHKKIYIKEKTSNSAKRFGLVSLSESFFFILLVRPSSASSCTSCWGPELSAGRCGTAALWRPTESVCLLQEDKLSSPTPDLNEMHTASEHLRNIRENSSNESMLAFILDVGLSFVLTHLAEQGHSFQSHHLQSPRTAQV